MDICHPDRVKLMETIIGIVPGMSFEYALEAACGDGRLSKDFLVKKFKNVDLFDIDQDSIDVVKKWAD